MHTDYEYDNDANENDDITCTAKLFYFFLNKRQAKHVTKTVPLCSLLKTDISPTILLNFSTSKISNFIHIVTKIPLIAVKFKTYSFSDTAGCLRCLPGVGVRCSVRLSDPWELIGVVVWCRYCPNSCPSNVATNSLGPCGDFLASY